VPELLGVTKKIGQPAARPVSFVDYEAAVASSRDFQLLLLEQKFAASVPAPVAEEPEAANFVRAQ
jgi:hypothetical protein